MIVLAHQIEGFLKGKMKDENIKVVAEIVDFLKYKEEQDKWEQIDQGEQETLTPDELKELEEIKSNTEYLSLDGALKSFMEGEGNV